MNNGGLWAQLGAAEMIQSCGPEIAEVLNQVDLLVAKKREEWDQELTNAVRREANEQKRIHQVKYSRSFCALCENWSDQIDHK